MEQSRIRVGNTQNVDGDFIVAGRDVYQGYTVEEVSTLIARLSTTFQPKPFDGRCPYKGLEVFEEEDSDLFFGRERLVAELVGRVERSRTLFLTGPSGSGKSSLARAGLIHALKGGVIKDQHSERWLFATMKPGRDPLEGLAQALSRLKSPELADYFRKNVGKTSVLNACAESVLREWTDQRFVLFIDQFEEVFTQVNSEEQRLAFLNVLTDAALVENGRVILVFAMRSDFVSNCATYPALNALLNQPSAFAQIGAMQRHELVSAIAEPAIRVGLRIDPDLVAQIINDMKGEPGTLPLMQFALKDLFDQEQARGGVIALTREGYIQRGGIYKSLERHADDSLAKLTDGEQVLARSIFSGLIEIGRGRQDTRRTAWFDELVPANANTAEVELLVRKLADARLIITDEQAGKDTVTISHERLIDAWPWLKKLVDENRDVIALQNEIAGDAKEWDEHGRDESYLYTGARLANAREKLAAKRLVLNGLSQTFLEAGIKAHTDELEAIKQRAAQLRKRALYLTVALISALVAGGVAVYLGLTAFSRQVAAQAVVLQPDRLDRALLMSVYAHKLNDDFETRSSLLSTVQCCADGLIALMRGHKDSLWDVAFSPDGKSLASAGNDGTIIVWDVNTRQRQHQIEPELSPTIYSLAFSPTGEYLASADAAGWIILYETEGWTPVAKLRHNTRASVLSIKFSKDGRWLVSGGTDGYVLIWDVANLQLYKIFVANDKGHTNWIWDVAMSADNQTIAAVSRIDNVHYNTLYLWSLTPPAATSSVFKTRQGTHIGFVSVAFNDNPSTQLLVTGDSGGNVVVWDLAPWRNHHAEPIPVQRLPTGPGATTSVWGLAFLPGHDLEIVTARDRGILNRNRIVQEKDAKGISKVTLQRQSLGMSGNNFGFFRIDVSPDGKYIAAAGQDGLVSLWNATEAPNVIRHDSAVTSLQLLDGESSVAMSVDQNGGVYRWDYLKRSRPEGLPLNTSQAIKSAISADGTIVVTGYKDGHIILWDGETGEKLADYEDHSVEITSLVFGPDGQHFASSDNEGNVILWNIGAGALKRVDQFTDPLGSSVKSLLFSHDGKMLVGAGCRYPIIVPARDCSQGVTYVWNTQMKFSEQDRKLKGKEGFASSLAFNPKHPQRLAVGTENGAVTVWDLETSQPRLELRLSEGFITALAFSLDGELLAVGVDSYTVSLFDSETGQRYGQSFREHDNPVTALFFTKEGDILSAASDQTVVIHRMDPAYWEERACQIANRRLEPEEWKVYVSNKIPYQRICPDASFELDTAQTP